MYEDNRKAIISDCQKIIGSNYSLEINPTENEKCINVHFLNENKRCLSIWPKKSGEIDVVFRPALHEQCIRQINLPTPRRVHHNQIYVRMTYDLFLELIKVVSTCTL